MRVKPRNTAARERAVKRLLEEAAVLRLLAAAFNYPDATTREGVTASFADVRSAQAHRLRSGSWSSAFRAADEAWKNADAARLESEHVRLFLGAGPCPLRETAYGDGRRMAGRSFELADIAGFYRAFGWKLSADRPQLPDHLSTELEFASVLLLKEAYAIAEGWEEQGSVTREATKDFLEAHLGRWLEALVAALVENGAPVVYVALADLTRIALDRQCRRFGIVPRLSEGRLTRDPMEDESFECPRDAALEPDAALGDTAHGRPLS